MAEDLAIAVAISFSRYNFSNLMIAIRIPTKTAASIPFPANELFKSLSTSLSRAFNICLHSFGLSNDSQQSDLIFGFKCDVRQSWICLLSFD